MSTTTISKDNKQVDKLHGHKSPTGPMVRSPADHKPCSVKLYVLRLAKPSESWKIQALFGNDIKYDFERQVLARPGVDVSKNEPRPYLYDLQLNVHVNKSKEIRIGKENRLHQNDTYRLCISAHKIGFNSHYDENRTRHLTIDPCQFLFNIHFEKGRLYDPPGSDIPSWNQLCIFTYFILNMKTYDTFNSLLKQFEIAVPDRTTISREDWEIFFFTCWMYVSSIENVVKQDFAALKILVHMIGYLPINRDNFIIECDAARHFTSIVLGILSDRLRGVVAATNETEWPSFQKGLVIILFIHLIQKGFKRVPNDPIRLLSTMYAGERREDTALKLLNLLSDFQCTLVENKERNLLALVDQVHLRLYHLRMAASLETYIVYVNQLLTNQHDNNHEFAEEMGKQLDIILQENDFTITLPDIVSVLKYLETQTNATENDINSVMIRQIQNIFETNDTLRSKIEQYLQENNDYFSLDDFAHIRDIIFRYYNPSLLNSIDRQQFLSRTLSRREDRTTNYFIYWFRVFLCEFNPDWMNYQELLQQWTKCFVRDPKMFSEIIEQIDGLIELWIKVAPDNIQRSDFFMKHMVKQCFRQENIFEVLMEELHKIKHSEFLDIFENQFYNDQLIPNKFCLKDLDNSRNPLFHLMNIDKQQTRKNIFVKRLIERAVSMIEINDDEIVRDTFNEPSARTCIYAILFNESLNSLQIHRTIIDRLDAYWKTWQKRGILARDVQTWKRFSPIQRTVVCQIWTLVTEAKKEQNQLDAVFNNAKQCMENVLEMIEKADICLKTYCQRGVDKNTYEAIIKEWNKSFEQADVRYIELPPVLMEIIQYATKLNPYANAHVWLTFIDRYGIHLKATELMGIKCLAILERVIDVLDFFQYRLQQICDNQQRFSIKDVLDVFSNIQQAENDMELLKPLFDSARQSLLHSIVSFWKNRSRIQHICKGLMKLSEKVSVLIDWNFLDSVCSINETTSIGTCVTIYEQYRNQFDTTVSGDILKLIAHYSSSSDLFDFLHQHTDNDVYNLQEAVNDWDETLVNTKTIFDLATVKNFLNRSYTAIHDKCQQLTNAPLQLEHVIECFENTMKDDQFVDLFKCLESSSLELTSIIRIHLELTDKEQSKRHQIADILQKSTIDFSRIGYNECTFDVNVELPSQQSSTNVEKKKPNIKFGDLSDLRDRARLLEYSSNLNKRNMSKDDNERGIEKLRQFIGLVSVIESTLETLANLYMTGHPSITESISRQKIFTFSCTDGKYDDLLENNTKLTSLHNEWDTKLCTMYETHIDLTYFSGNQFWLVEDYIYDRESFSHPGYHLLKFIGIDSNSIEQPFERQQQPEDRLNNLGYLLSKQRQELHRENLNIENVPLVETTNEGILRAILSLFSLMKTPAAVHRLFYCTSHTNWIQIRGFIYRCFYSQTLHQLIRPELLSQSIQDRFVDLLRLLIKIKPQQVFQLGIITTTTLTHQQLINGLRSMQILKILRDQELLTKDNFQKKINQLIRNCMLVTSRIAGLGKSSIIRREIEQLGIKTYVKFPICGDFDTDTLAERLQSKFSQLQTRAIHIDIGSIDNSQQLNEILYSLLLFGSFRFGQVAVSIPAETHVFIELDASIQSTFTEITLFQYLHSPIKLIDVNWAILNAADSKIQTVANYLQAIESQTIIKKNVDLSKSKTLDVATCSDLIKRPFLRDKDCKYITWTQLSIFIGIFNHLFTGFSRCSYFLAEYIPKPTLRMDLVQTLLRCSNQFTSLSVKNLRTQQQAVANDEPTTFSDTIVRWNTVQPFTFVFTSTNDPLFVYKSPTNIPQALIEYFKSYSGASKQGKKMTKDEMFPDYAKLTHAELFIKLTSLSTKYFNKSICPKCFRQYDFKQQQCQNTECSIKDELIRPKSIDPKDVEQFQRLIAKSLQNEYVLTPDNFIKMLLIYLRVQSDIPVLIMGETGCGKTSLIQFLCQKLLDDELETFRMHAGVTAEKIIKTMEAYIVQAQECKKQEKRLWIFFDEFNTTANISLLKEIICERTLLGESLPSNMVFLGACNPRRQKTSTSKINDDPQIGLRKNRYEMQKLTDRRLLYIVVPIPETMIEYIWDYGYLDESTEEAYIKTMLNACHHLSSFSEVFNLTVALLVGSQNHYRDIEDVSSVSLRDIARFCRLYNWFLESLTQRDHNEEPCLLCRRASLIALMLCYYFRSRSAKRREVYIDKMQLILKNYDSHLVDTPEFSMKNILESEQKKLIDEKMELPRGTAANRALLDNIFVLFACIMNRIPLFLCGKPGSSKSSAVQILISSLKGKKSKDEYFQTLPELVAVSYQGSQNSTSESIIKVFERAARYSQVKGESELLPVIVFDEIGLAELSPHNPLKVLHAELEIEKCQYGFVGISNWRLDAAKMNRALYLATPEPDIKDLHLTGTTISKNMTSSITLEENIIESLAKSYHNLHKNLEDTTPDHENYFGLRDYYSLIKGIMRDLTTENDQTKIYKIIRRQLKINFDGELDGSLLLWEQFCYYINKEHLINEYPSPTFDLLLDQALDVRSGRYLMLIADNESIIDYVERHISIHQQKKNVAIRTLVGSSFSDDLLSDNTYAEQYNYRILMDIILYAEMNVTLIMRQMGHLYDNLYDLFNQNFAVSAKKQYCRIALGPLYHPRCLINDNFYCIVFIHKRDVEKCDPPFLNRFEKHLIDIQTLIHPQHKLLTRELHTWLENLIPKNIGKHFSLFKHLFVDYSPDWICNLVIEAFEQLNMRIDDEQTDVKVQAILDYCRTHLIYTSSFDLPLVLSLHSTPDKQMLIDKYYDVHQSITFEKLIEQSLQNDQISLKIIYTYTQIFHQINALPNVQEVKLGAFKTELELTKKIKHHYQTSTNIRLLLIRVDYHSEHQHILSLKHILLNEYVSQSNRGIWIVFHLQRNLLNQVNNDILFSGWSAHMIDDLNHRELISRNVLENPSYSNLVLQPEYRLSECAFDRLVDQCLSKFRYILFQTNLDGRINQRRKENFEQLIQHHNNSTINNLHLRSIVEKHLIVLIEKISPSTNTGFNDWRLDLLTNGLTIAGSRSFQDAFQTTISNFYEVYLCLLLAHLEKYNFIDAYVFLSTNIHDKDIQEHLSKLWNNCFISTFEKIDVTRMNLDMIEIPLVFDLKLPCAAAEYKTIQSIREKFEQLENFSSDKIDFFLDQAHISSVYGEDFIELIINNKQLLEFYFHDQILMHLNETKIQLLPEFVYQLLTSNPTRSFKQYKRVFFAKHGEFTNILRLFEISLQLVGETDILDIIQNQLIENPIGQIRSSEFYMLVLTDHQFYQLPPKTTIIADKWKFECNGDPMIETSLMNLIELILSPSVIDRANNIQQITTIYSSIAQGIHNLLSYSVNNLERLRSFISLIRCLTTLLPDKALDVFKRVSKNGFDANFIDCSAIQRFIDGLKTNIDQEHPTVDENIVHEALTKLEIDFIKHWLADPDNIKSYGVVLRLLSGLSNDLWRYSARIFTIIINLKLKLISTLKENHGKLPLNDEYKHFNESLKIETNPLKIEQLIVNGVHMYLMLGIQGDEIDGQLTENYSYFEENFNAIQSQEQLSTGQFISYIAWLKFYAQIYAFALNNDNKEDILARINRFLLSRDTPFCSTIKLFILKQLLQMSELTLNGLRDVYVNRNVPWIKSFLQRSQSQQVQNVYQQFSVLPTPIFQCQKQFKDVRKIFNELDKTDQIREMIRECGTKQELAYACLCWFIQYYCRFALPNMNIDDTFCPRIERDFHDDLIRSFTSFGHKFIVSLCSNFSNESYFRLHPTMIPLEVHKRLLALNIVAVFISFKSRSEITLLSNILFDAQREMPVRYIEHISSICLPGLTVSDPIITQMIDVRTQVHRRLKRNEIHDDGNFIFQCSQECQWMFYFEQCGAPIGRTECPLCKKPIGAKEYNVLIERDPPQIRMSIDEGLQKINDFINQTNRLGYYNVKTAETSSLGEKPDHLNGPVSFRFIHFLTHGLLLFLYDQNYLTENDLKEHFKLPANSFFRDHFENDYVLLSKASTDSHQCYIWLYKLLNHLVDERFAKQGLINTNENVIEIEKLIEQKLVFEHIDSVASEIIKYKVAYFQLINEHNAERSLENFIDELFQDQHQFPHLHFFNVTKFYTSDPLDEFIWKIQTRPYGEQVYPVTTFLLKHLDDYSNIQYLYPLVYFTNYLIEKFNHRIKRSDAIERKMIYYLRTDKDQETTQKLFDYFLNTWYALDLKEVRYGCQTAKFERNVSKEKFAENISLAMLLLNQPRDDSSLLLLACLKTLAEMQNNIVKYFYNTIERISGTATSQKYVPLQLIRPEHIFRLDRKDLSKKLINDSLVLNYEYGKGKDAIYDYEEIEITLRNQISSLVMIDTDKIHFLTYQFELHGENASLINEVRARIKQERLTNDDRTKLYRFITTRMSNDNILHYLGSLDYIFTYLRNGIVDDKIGCMTIQRFVERHIYTYACLNDNILHQPQFSTIELRYIIDFYEILEENAFDKVLRDHVRKELREETFGDNEQRRVINRFSCTTFENETIAVTLKTIDCWISMLKRLMVRVLSVNVSLDVSLQLYLQRTDLWSDPVDDRDLETFQVDDDILLKHTYVILGGLEKKQMGGHRSQQRPETQSVEEQQRKVETWHKNVSKPISGPKMITNKTKFR